MLFTIPTEIVGTNRRRIPPISNSLIIAANVIIFVLGYSWSWGVGNGSSIFTIFTYSFIHADLAHLITNMWILWLFGNAVNERVGNQYFLLCYFGISTVLGFSAWIFSGGLLVGSSGVIFGVVAMATLLLAGTRIRFFYVALIPVTLIIGLMKRPRHALGWILRWDHASFLTLYGIVIVPLLEAWGVWRWSRSGIVNWTHLGHLFGFMFGVIAVLLLPTKVSLNK